MLFRSPERKKTTVEEERSGEKESFGGSGRRSNGRSDGRSLRAQALLTGRPVVAGPTTTPVEAEEIVAAGAAVALHVSRPWQALLGPQRFAFDDSGVPIVGPGATVGTVETRVPRAGLPGPIRSFSLFSLRTRLSACRGSPSLSRLSMPVESLQACRVSTRDLSTRRRLKAPPGIPLRTKPRGLPRFLASRGFLPLEASSASAAERTWALCFLQSHGRAKAR